MLFRAPVLEAIARGSVTLAFRRWKRPTVKAGGTLKTAVGVLAIASVDAVDDIADRDARRAGFVSRAAALAALGRRDDTLYRIEFRLAGPDPRVALREDDALSDADVAALRARLARLDRASGRGPWTRRTLELLRDRPRVRAAALAAAAGRAAPAFKRDVRKLKEFGLTESLDTGYRLSARGRAFLERTA